jgi:hypothetical protein
LLNDQELRNRLADAGYKHVVERFSFDRLINSLETLYQQGPELRPVSPVLRDQLSTPAVKVPLATHASE